MQELVLRIRTVIAPNPWNINDVGFPGFSVYLERLKKEPDPKPLQSRRVLIVVAGDAGIAH